MKNKILGSALIVAGTTIGAGMLAMPLTSAGIGFGMTVVLLVGLWLLLTYTGLLFMEVYQTAPYQDAGVATLAEQYLGIFGRIWVTINLLILLYALLAAYITGGGSLLSGIMPAFIEDNIRLKLSIVLFTLFLGLFVISGVKSVDGATRVLFIGKIFAFLCVLALMFPNVAIDNLMETPIDSRLALSAMPIFFTSFGFHVIMASINSYLDADIRKIRIAIIIGTLIPLVAYLLWQLATHGVLTQTEFVAILQKDPSLNGLVGAVKQITSGMGILSNIVGEVVRIFSALALITSFLGVALGIFECTNDLLKRVNLPTNRAILSALTFLPPLTFALFNPEGFVLILGYAGLLFAFYGLVLPILLAFLARKAHPELPYRVMGGNIGLLIALMLGMLIIAIPFLIEAGYLPNVVG